MNVAKKTALAIALLALGVARVGFAAEMIDPAKIVDLTYTFDEHTIYYCPECQTEGRVLKDRRLSRLLR